MTKSTIREMFTNMVAQKDISQAPRYYHPEFVMYANGITQDYESFVDDHRTLYETAIQYTIEYDEGCWVEQDDKVAARVWITTSRPNEEPVRIEVILITTFRDDRIFRLWEVTWPSWTNLKGFEAYGQD